MPSTHDNRWRIRFREGGGSWEGPLVAYWEVELDPMSDDYTPEEISAHELLRKWAVRARQKHSDGLIPISWFVESREAGKFESMPFAYNHFPGEDRIEDFRYSFGWPEHAATGERLNWLALPVVDKQWSKRGASKGGFIQEATGWKPSVLQPFVYLPSLLEATG